MKCHIVLSLLLLPLLVAQASATLVISAGGVAVTQNFDGLGTGLDLSVLDGADGWKVAASATPTYTDPLNTFSALTQLGSGSFTVGGSYNFRGSSTDRAIGFLTAGVFNSPRSILLKMSNASAETITKLDIAFDYEKYRTGTRALNYTFHHGADGTAWAAATDGDHFYDADAGTTTYGLPLSTVTKSVTLSGLSIPSGSSYYLRWFYAGVGGSSNSQAVGIDNFSVTATTLAAVPEASSFLLGGLALAGVGFGTVARRLRLRKVA
ncbi:MAG TPA: hypothetical protein VEQ85_10370 [Lacipirellulaceae bacterium]|nr:hypothetical protein [Lacipirellulaceae bacterium]